MLACFDASVDHPERFDMIESVYDHPGETSLTEDEEFSTSF